MLRYNIYKMYLLKSVMWFMVAMPIIILFFQSHGLTLTEVMILQSVYSFSIALFEIPSGYIADIIGRKETIIMSTIFSFLGYLFFSFSSGFWLLMAGQILIGIGGSLMSGSDSALIYDTLLEIGDDKSYTKIEGRSYGIGNFSESIAGILGGFLAVSSIYYPVYLQTIILFLSIPISMTLVEPSINKNNNYSYKYLLSVIKSSMIENKKLKWLIVYSSAMGVGTLSIAWFSQPFFKQIDVPLLYFGILWAALNFSAGITSFNSHHIKYIKAHKLLLIVSISMFISFIMIGINNSFFGLIFIFFIYIIRGIITPVLRNEININTTSERRATVLSIRSFLIRVSFSISAPLLGYIADNYSLATSFYILSLIVFSFSFLSYIRMLELD